MPIALIARQRGPNLKHRWPCLRPGSGMSSRHCSSRQLFGWRESLSRSISQNDELTFTPETTESINQQYFRQDPRHIIVIDHSPTFFEIFPGAHFYRCYITYVIGIGRGYSGHPIAHMGIWRTLVPVATWNLEFKIDATHEVTGGNAFKTTSRPSTIFTFIR